MAKNVLQRPDKLTCCRTLLSNVPEITELIKIYGFLYRERISSEK
jgi:hypothetical protein